MPFFKFEGQRLAYTEFGGGPAAMTRRRRARTHRAQLAGVEPRR